MWTPRRVLLLILGVVLFGSAFGVYLHFLGWIDGLPQLPEEFLVRRADNEPFPERTLRSVEQKLLLAFPDSATWYEIDYNHKIELHSKGIVLAFREFSIEGGRVKLSPFSLATIKEHAEHPGEFPEINTVHCDIAYLEFDKPVKTVVEIGPRRIVACQLKSDPALEPHDPRRGHVHITNNRSTPSANDDLCLETPGPIFYREADQPDQPLDKATPQIYTREVVRLVDKRNQPQSTTVDAQGMQVYLMSVETPDATVGTARRAGRPRSGSVNVRRVVMPANVNMNLWMDAKDSFLADATAKSPPEPAKAPAERRNVQITTFGPFIYDVLPDGTARARFDRPAAGAQLPNNCVRVVRPQVGQYGLTNDVLECDALEMQFTTKALPKSVAPASRPAVKPRDAADNRTSELDWVHAWGQQVLMNSDEQNLVAHGTDLFHDARTQTTVLRGSPMVAIQDGNQIHAPELVFYGTESKEGKQVVARGAGRFIMPAGPGPKRAAAPGGAGEKRPAEARWRDQCVYRPDDGFRLLTLTGEAIFEDQTQGQMLRANQIKLWLVQEARPAAPAGPSPAGARVTKPRPRKMEATGRVAARSRDLTIHDTESLVLLFEDAAPGPPKPAALVAVTPPPGPYQAGKTPAGPAPATSQPAGPPPRPTDLQARSITAFLVLPDDGSPGRDGAGEQIRPKSVHCEGNVRVRQDPQSPTEKPVDMSGRTLELTHTAEGNILVVTGTADVPGRVNHPELSLLGTRITINQVLNSAEVDGCGSMRMVSQTDFEGNKLKEPTDLTVTWVQGMTFNGRMAQFREGVNAYQDNRILRCEDMQVYLSRPVSLNQRPGEVRSPGEAAAIDSVFCNSAGQPQGVTLHETERDPKGGRLLKSQRVQASELTLHKEERRLEAGVEPRQYGYVNMIQLGPRGDPTVSLSMPSGPAGRGPVKAPAKPVELEYKLTWIRFDGRMTIDHTKRTVQFLRRAENIDLLYLPATAEGLPLGDVGTQLTMDRLINKLPAGALHLSCQRLTVYSFKDSHVMWAEGGAIVQWQNEFYGVADKITFDEKQQIMTLEGLSSPARVELLNARPGQQKSMPPAKKFIYNRLTGQVQVNQAW